jgi:hypothetical protein
MRSTASRNNVTAAFFLLCLAITILCLPWLVFNQVEAEVSTIPNGPTLSQTTANGGTTLNGIRGWRVSSAPSEYEFGTTTNYELIFQSMGPQAGPYGGDGILKLQSNLTAAGGSNAAFLSWKGDLSAARDGVYSNRMIIIGISLANATIDLGGTAGFNNSNKQVTINVSNTFWRFTWQTQLVDGALSRIIDGGMTPPTINPDLAYTLMASNLTISGGGSNPLFPAYHISTNNGATTLGGDSYYILGQICQALTATSVVTTQGNIRCTPFYSGAGGLVDSLGARVTVGGTSTLRFGLADSQSATNFLPGNVLFQTGAIDNTTTGMKLTNLVTKIRLDPGHVYYAWLSAGDGTMQHACMNSTALGTQILGFNTSGTSMLSIESTNVYGALGATIPLTTTIIQSAGNFTPAIFARFSSR